MQENGRPPSVEAANTTFTFPVDFDGVLEMQGLTSRPERRLIQHDADLGRIFIPKNCGSSVDVWIQGADDFMPYLIVCKIP